MNYTKSQMVYTDYKWTANADHDNPKIIAGADHTELNRTEGYEMLYFINSLAKAWGWASTSLASCKKLETIIREKVPTSTRTHKGIKTWIESNYKNI